jgi:uncharacterized protein YbjT (DUF2867 family)
MHKVFVTGGTGYIGTRPLSAREARGHERTALVRAGALDKVAQGHDSLPAPATALEAAGDGATKLGTAPRGRSIGRSRVDGLGR